MNKQRRTRIEQVQDKMWDLISELQDILEEEKNAYDSLPESLQESIKGERMCDGIYKFDEALETFASAYNEIGELVEEY